MELEEAEDREEGMRTSSRRSRNESNSEFSIPSWGSDRYIGCCYIEWSYYLTMFPFHIQKLKIFTPSKLGDEEVQDDQG